MSCNDAVLGEDVAALPAIVNRSDLPSLEVQLLDEHSLPTGPQGPEKLRLSVWRSTAQGSQEMHELRQEISVGRRGKVGRGGEDCLCARAVCRKQRLPCMRVGGNAGVLPRMRCCGAGVVSAAPDA